MHAPTEEKDEDEKDTFYDQRERALEAMPKQDMRIMCGDFNAKIGKKENFRPTIGTHSLHDVRSLRGADGDTDHILVRAKIKIKTSTHKYRKAKKVVRWNTEKLKCERDRTRFQENIEHQLEEKEERQDV